MTRGQHPPTTGHSDGDTAEDQRSALPSMTTDTCEGLLERRTQRGEARIRTGRHTMSMAQLPEIVTREQHGTAVLWLLDIP